MCQLLTKNTYPVKSTYNTFFFQRVVQGNLNFQKLDSKKDCVK